MTTLTQIESAALALSGDDREQLAHRLLESLEPETNWNSEIQRRLDAIDSGEESTLTEQEFRESVRTLREAVEARAHDAAR